MYFSDILSLLKVRPSFCLRYKSNLFNIGEIHSTIELLTDYTF